MRLRMTEQDREAYGAPEWLDWPKTVEWLNDQPAGELIALDDELRTVLTDVPGPLLWLCAQVADETPRLREMRVLRAWAWLMLRADGSAVALADFAPRLMAMKPDRGGDADPPSGGEESSPTSTPSGPEASPESGTSTSNSDPGSVPATPE